MQLSLNQPEAEMSADILDENDLCGDIFSRDVESSIPNHIVNKIVSFPCSETSSITSMRENDLYYDDELRMSLEFDQHHLGLSEDVRKFDMLNKEFVPMSILDDDILGNRQFE